MLAALISSDHRPSFAVMVLTAAVAPSLSTQKAHLESWRAVAKTAGAGSAAARLSWMPAMETDEAPACQRIDLCVSGANSPTR